MFHPANDNSALSDIASAFQSNDLTRLIDRKFRIEASTSNPETRSGYERDNISDYCLVRNISLAFDQAVLYLEHGYWVEVYDEGNNTLLAGPFDPNDLHPTLINFIGGGAA